VVDDTIDLEIPSMLSAVWNRPHTGQYISRFAQNVRIARGVLTYAE
jgi:hypothetical protein